MVISKNDLKKTLTIIHKKIIQLEIDLSEFFYELDLGKKACIFNEWNGQR